MKLLVILCMAFIATSGSVLYHQPAYSAIPVRETVINAPVRTQYHAQDELGQYAYGYAHEGGTYKVEAKTLDGTVVGQYGYTAPDGRRIEIKYKADDINGFVATGDAIPKSVEVPAMVPLANAYYVTPEKTVEKEESYKPEKVHSGYGEPGKVDSGYGKPDQVDSGYGKPDQVDSGYGKPDQVDSGYGKPGKVDSGYGKPDQVDSGYGKPGKGETGYEPAEKGEVPYIPPPENIGVGAYYFANQVPLTHYFHPFYTQPQVLHTPILLKSIPAKPEEAPKVAVPEHKSAYTFPVHFVKPVLAKVPESPKIPVAAVKTVPVHYVAPYQVQYVPSIVPVHAVKVEKTEPAEPAPSPSKKY